MIPQKMQPPTQKTCARLFCRIRERDSSSSMFRQTCSPRLLYDQHIVTQARCLELAAFREMLARSVCFTALVPSVCMTLCAHTRTFCIADWDLRILIDTLLSSQRWRGPLDTLLATTSDASRLVVWCNLPLLPKVLLARGTRRGWPPPAGESR